MSSAGALVLDSFCSLALLGIFLGTLCGRLVWRALQVERLYLIWAGFGGRRVRS